MSPMDLFDIREGMRLYEEMSGLIADAIIRRLHPVRDDISENQALKEYGEKWLKRMKREGLAEYRKVGNRNVFSRHQLDCLREAERLHARLVFSAVRRTRETVDE